MALCSSVSGRRAGQNMSRADADHDGRVTREELTQAHPGGAMESATIPAGDVIDPKRTIPISTVLGISIAALLYVFGTTAVMGLVPREQLIHSVAPFSDAARVIWGGWGAAVISIAVIISALGALNGWTLLMEAGGGKIEACLKAKIADLSDACKVALANAAAGDD